MYLVNIFLILQKLNQKIILNKLNIKTKKGFIKVREFKLWFIKL